MPDGETADRPVADERQPAAERERAKRIAARRALLELLPVGPQDLDAAARRWCSCHPQPAGDPHHGETCVCQLTEPERRQRTARARETVRQIAEGSRPAREQHLRELPATAAELGVDAHEEVIAAPWVLTGTVDGVAWYMRERWDTYAIAISSGEDPSIQPWGARGVQTTTIREGDANDLYQGTPPDYGHALRFIVGVIREHLTRASCEHPHRDGDRYCPRCGVALTDPAQTR
ncbi:hypothetical protein [Cellulomonas massiliensis]|uniref:hypothetical protein n=1 Tax=Cellulomonas massiliensis TaxID=1465811 RepID=UPI0002ECD4AC|nr:hypothetical protein [Cellulomonas massiliensis]